MKPVKENKMEWEISNKRKAGKASNTNQSERGKGNEAKSPIIEKSKVEERKLRYKNELPDEI